MERGHYTPTELINKIFAVAESTPKLRALGIETVAFQKVLIYMMKDEMRRRGKYLPLRELRADTDKIRRARMIQPAWENGDIYISKAHCSALVKELLDFPMTSNDDTVDAAAYVEQMLKPAKSSRKRKEEPYQPTSSITGY